MGRKVLLRKIGTLRKQQTGVKGDAAQGGGAKGRTKGG